MTVRFAPRNQADARLWRTTLEVAKLLASVPWVLVGAQMVRLLQLERGRGPGRASLDVDVVVDSRMEVQATRIAADRLTGAGFVVSPERPYRFMREVDQVDVLAPDGLGTKADLTTVPPLRTTQVPGGTRAANSVRKMAIEVAGVGTGTIHVPTLAGAIVMKVRAHQARAAGPDLGDIVRLLDLVEDVDRVRRDLTPREREALGGIQRLQDPSAAIWQDAADPPEARAAFARLSS